MNNIEHYLIKNRVLDNSSNKLNKVFYEDFSGEVVLKLNTGGYLNNGYIFIDVKTDSEIKIYYKEILIFSSNKDLQKMVPSLFEKKSSLKIIGNCEKLQLLVFGAEIDNYRKKYFLPKNNVIINNCGEVYREYKYNNFEQIKSNEISLNASISNLVCSQSINFNGDNYIGYLINDNGLYFTTSFDNYTKKIIITDEFIDATIIPDVNNNVVFVFYIFQNKLHYRIINSDLSISDDNVLNMKFDDMLKGFLNIVIQDYIEPLFVLSLCNQKSLLIMFDNNKWSCKLIKKACNIEIVSCKNYIEIFDYNANFVNVSKYEIVKNSGDTLLVSSSIKQQINNIDKILKCDNKYLLYNDDFVTEVDYDKLFSN